MHSLLRLGLEFASQRLSDILSLPEAPGLLLAFLTPLSFPSTNRWPTWAIGACIEHVPAELSVFKLIKPPKWPKEGTERKENTSRCGKNLPTVKKKSQKRQTPLLPPVFICASNTKQYDSDRHCQRLTSIDGPHCHIPQSVETSLT